MMMVFAFISLMCREPPVVVSSTGGPVINKRSRKPGNVTFKHCDVRDSQALRMFESVQG